MRVLILTTEYLPKLGGSEVAIENLTKRLSTQTGDPNIHFDIISSGFGGKWLLPLTGFLRALRLEYDVIHAWQASYAGGAAWLLKIVFPRKPFVVTLQEGKDLAKQSFFVRYFRSVILRKADVITTISNYLLVFAKTINPRARYVLLPNGVDTEKFSPGGVSALDKNVIISVSRLVPKNGLDILIRAMPDLPDYVLKIAGTGPQEQELRKFAQSLGVESRVHFLGNVSQKDLPAFLHEGSVFVRPSRSEGLGVSFLEAMAAGIPVVAPPVGGIPDFLADGETGIFCQVDDPASVVASVKKLENPLLRKNIVGNARKMIEERFSWDSLAEQYRNLLFSL